MFNDLFKFELMEQANLRKITNFKDETQRDAFSKAFKMKIQELEDQFTLKISPSNFIFSEQLMTCSNFYICIKKNRWV